MPDKLWKQTERRIAKAFGGKRNSLSGSNSKVTSADVIHSRYYIEVKERKKIPFYKVFLEVKENAKKEGRIPILVIHEKNRKEDLVIIGMSDFIDLLE